MYKEIASIALDSFNFIEYVGTGTNICCYRKEENKNITLKRVKKKKRHLISSKSCLLFFNIN